MAGCERIGKFCSVNYSVNLLYFQSHHKVGVIKQNRLFLVVSLREQDVSSLWVEDFYCFSPHIWNNLGLS